MRTRFIRSNCGIAGDKSHQVWVGLGGARFCRSELGQSGDERHQFQVRPNLGPESPDPGEVQVGPQSQGPGEVQVATGFTKSR